jgi:ATP-dependent DNA helicase PIF1
MHISRFNITAIIINGPFAGNIHHIPRMQNYSSDLDVPFKLRRLQFPIRPAFALTINKSQGQTLQCAGLYLQSPVFSHGQLYVALSRTTTIRTLHVLIENEDSDVPHGQTINVVYPEILQ